jgi:hypothetical protein
MGGKTGKEQRCTIHYAGFPGWSSFDELPSIEKMGSSNLVESFYPDRAAQNGESLSFRLEKKRCTSLGMLIEN